MFADHVIGFFVVTQFVGFCFLPLRSPRRLRIGRVMTNFGATIMQASNLIFVIGGNFVLHLEVELCVPGPYDRSSYFCGHVEGGAEASSAAILVGVLLFLIPFSVGIAVVAELFTFEPDAPPQ